MTRVTWMFWILKSFKTVIHCQWFCSLWINKKTCKTINVIWQSMISPIFLLTYNILSILVWVLRSAKFNMPVSYPCYQWLPKYCYYANMVFKIFVYIFPLKVLKSCWIKRGEPWQDHSSVIQPWLRCLLIPGLKK